MELEAKETKTAKGYNKSNSNMTSMSTIMTKQKHHKSKQKLSKHPQLLPNQSSHQMFDDTTFTPSQLDNKNLN